MSKQSKLTLIDRVPDQDFVVFIGSKYDMMHSNLYSRIDIEQKTWQKIIAKINPGMHGTVHNIWIGEKECAFAILPKHQSRDNSPAKTWPIPNLLSSLRNKKTGSIIAVIEKCYREATAMAIAKAFPSFSIKQKITKKEFFLEISDDPIENYRLQVLVNAVQFAANLFDRPPNILRVSNFVQEAKDIADRTKSNIKIWNKQQLIQDGFGGIIGVGKAADDGPAFVVLHHKPKESSHSIAWVGKGIVYDTGGLSIKTKTGMPAMKGDMGGAGAVLAAFEAAVLLNVPYELYAILCLAENSVGPQSTRPDDVLTMLSGKTVEVNNTDAEGRLVMADGVYWASKVAGCNTIFDIATLTGAAPMSVGSNFAALYCNDADLEKYAVRAGKVIGELCHPLPYTPEFYIQEFYSAIADMKNSVKNRSNAQSACAGEFVGRHLFGNPYWLHIDIAGPAWGAQKRGTGFGVGLLLKTTEMWAQYQEEISK